MWKHRIILTAISVLLPAVASGVQPEGIVFEAEAISTPRSAWLDNRSDDTHWNLWTREQDIDKKRSGGAVLASPAVKADRATPDEGAPALHSVAPGLKPGWYRVFAGAPGRPLAYSLDGKEWTTVAGHVDRLPADYVHADAIGPITSAAELSPNELAELESLVPQVG